MSYVRAPERKLSMTLSDALTSAETRIIVQLAEALDRSTLRFLDIETGDFRIRLAKDSSQPALTTTPALQTEDVTAKDAILVTAPAVGIYRALNGGGRRGGKGIDANFLPWYAEKRGAVQHTHP